MSKEPEEDEGSDFEFNYCPECGGTDLTWPFVIAMADKIRRCRACGKEWHCMLEED